jgi:hypothetical protein
MTREERLKAIWLHAVPDVRLIPGLEERLQKLPRNVRRVQKRVIHGNLKATFGRVLGCQQSGAGFPIDAQLREYLIEYNDRVMGHGLLTLPMSFNDTEGFCVFYEKPTNHFLLRPEKDHLFSFADFLDYATDPARTEEQGAESLGALAEGVIHSYTPIGDVRDTAFLHSDSRRLVIAGITFVRHGEEVSWMMLGGPICDLLAETEKIRKHPLQENGRPSEKQFINFSPDLERRAEPLEGTDDVWKTVLSGRFNLQTHRFDSRSVAVDYGNHYVAYTDDPAIFQKKSLDALSDAERLRMEGMAKELAENCLEFEIASTCFLLPAYFAHRITLVRDNRRATKLDEADRATQSAVAALPESARPRFRRVASLEILNVGAEPRIRSYRPPSYRIEVDGFWRRLEPGQVGHDQFGKPVSGRTWVKGHIRWRELPERKSTIYVKSTLAAAKARAAAILASDPTATVAGDELPDIPPEDHTNDVQSDGSVYVMRCPLMDEDVYKVGWTMICLGQQAFRLLSWL